MAFTLIKVHHLFKNPTGSPSSGVIAFRLSARMTNGGVTYAEQVPVHSTLSVTGKLTVTLPANDDTGTTPKGSTYLATFMLNGYSGDEVAITIPHTATTGTVDLGTLLPQQQGE